MTPYLCRPEVQDVARCHVLPYGRAGTAGQGRLGARHSLIPRHGTAPQRGALYVKGNGTKDETTEYLRNLAALGRRLQRRPGEGAMTAPASPVCIPCPIRRIWDQLPHRRYAA